MSAFEDIGSSIMNEVVDSGILSTPEPGLIVWAANSPEVLEAIVGKYCHELHRRILNNLPTGL